jgi:hypothetical protein
MACHIIHLAMPARVEPSEQMRLLGLETGVGDPDLAESQFETPGADVARECAEIGRRCDR